MDLLTEMRIPTRAAPKPPGGNSFMQHKILAGTTSSSTTTSSSNSNSNRNSRSSSSNSSSSGSIDDIWNNIGSNNLFGSSTQVNQKRKPPRPPPPNLKNLQKLGTLNIHEKPKKPARPTELLSNLFGRRGSKQHTSVPNTATTNSKSFSTGHSIQNHSSQPQGFTSSFKAQGCLIDLSPPNSPTFTTRSSDGVSVDSFGSDGNSNPSTFTSGSSCSQTENAFEDDFDFFGNLSSNNQPQLNNDPWKLNTNQEPFGLFDNNASKVQSGINLQQQWPVTNIQPIKEIGESNFFVQRALIDNLAEPPKPKPFKMPTIIWPARQKQNSQQSKQSPVHVPAKSNIVSNNSTAPLFNITNNKGKDTNHHNDNESDKPSSSPPMPTLPPPPPPPECEAGIEDLAENTERPYGIALYDFSSDQIGDLNLKEGEVVYLTKLVDDNWMEGRVGSREGMFPINFVDIKVPLAGTKENVVNALYSFKAEASDDLSFEEGAIINVLFRISDDWLYGECGGRKGQFPANFVDRIPDNLPNYS